MPPSRDWRAWREQNGYPPDYLVEQEAREETGHPAMRDAQAGVALWTLIVVVGALVWGIVAWIIG